ncbi:hypothetical protein Acr_14g0006490 [Actinidia rufa]|uniref:Uncharacterized protein n=1 Tax=Actinidia rufa TaxID=165716 RepID=A0A7J0FR11_9ERIC|nr:hypothetical protein Acr_14g0006490 [Actinidia rufa]
MATPLALPSSLTLSQSTPAPASPEKLAMPSTPPSTNAILNPSQKHLNLIFWSELSHKICKTASEIPCPYQRATPLPTEVPVPLHRSACTFSPRCPAPLTGVHCKVCHFESYRGSISPPLCAQLERSLQLIKLERKRLVSALSHPSLYSFSKSTLSPFSELLSRHSALVAPLMSSQISYISQKHLLVLLYRFGSSKYPVLGLRASVQWLLSLSILLANTTGPISDSSSPYLDTPL